MACSVNHRESVQIPYKNINDSHSAKLTCFPYIYIYTHETYDTGLTLLPPPGRHVPRRSSTTGGGALGLSSGQTWIG